MIAKDVINCHHDLFRALVQYNKFVSAVKFKHLTCRGYVYIVVEKRPPYTDNLYTWFIFRELNDHILFLFNLYLTCEDMTEIEVERLYDEGYTRMQDKPCVANISHNTDINRMHGNTTTDRLAPTPISSQWNSLLV